MDVATTVSLNDDEVDLLINALGGSATDLQTRLQDLGRAAVREYVEMLLGSNPLRNTENRERRLLLIMLEASNGQIVDESEVARYFNITPSSARTLLRSVISKHRRQMKPAMDAAARYAIEQCGPADAKSIRKVIVQNAVVVEYMNSRLVAEDGTLQRISRNPGTGNQYLIQSDSYDKLSQVLL